MEGVFEVISGGEQIEEGEKAAAAAAAKECPASTTQGRGREPQVDDPQAAAAAAMEAEPAQVGELETWMVSCLTI